MLIERIFVNLSKFTMLSCVDSVKEKEDLHPDLESPGINDDTFCEYRYYRPPPRFTVHIVAE